jgi:hypothetical protein
MKPFSLVEVMYLGMTSNTNITLTRNDDLQYIICYKDANKYSMT